MWTRGDVLGYALVAPTVLVILGLSVIPMVYSGWLLVHSYNPLRPATTQFVGTGNLELLLQDPRVWQALRTTLVYVGIAVPISFVLGLAIALLFNQGYPGVRLFRGLALIPLMVMPVAVGLTFQMLFEFRIGVFNWIVSDLLGLPRVQWLADPTMALVSVIIMDVWQHTPFAMMVLLAGLRSMPSEPVEAARVDGATGWQVFRHITLPYLQPLILVVFLLRFIGGFKLFDEIYALTQAGPGQATETLAYYVYILGFKAFDLGYASAVSYVMLAVLASISLVFIWRLERGRADVQ
jgi:ABC-type sugar transport system permease subunit